MGAEFSEKSVALKKDRSGKAWMPGIEIICESFYYKMDEMVRQGSLMLILLIAFRWPALAGRGRKDLFYEVSAA